MSLYSDVFWENIGAATVVPYMRDATFFAMQAFGGFDLQWAALLAVLGSALGAAANWGIGRLLLALYRKSGATSTFTAHTYERASRLFAYSGVWAFPFSWLPLMNMFVLAGGFFGVRLRVALPLVVVGQGARYGWYLHEETLAPLVREMLKTLGI